MAELYENSVCPICKSKLKFIIEHSKLVCVNPLCKREFFIEDGIPIILLEDVEEEVL